MSATQELIAAVSAAADELDEIFGWMKATKSRTAADLREACARAMVQPDMAEVEMLLDEVERNVRGHEQDARWAGRLYNARSALLDYVRGVLAERGALIADNERLSGLYEQAVKGRADMRSALRESRAAAPQPVGEEPCRIEQPTGWRCTRAGGHEGPCAAVEDRS